MIKLAKPFVGKEEAEAIQKVLDSGWLTEGPVTGEFERIVADYIGVNHALAVTSCTTAMELALRALGIGIGDEVIIADFTYPATGDAVCLVKSSPVLADADIKTYNIGSKNIESLITEKTKAIMPVSEFGNPIDYRIISEIKKKHGLYVIEDAACSLGAEFEGKKTGSIADITCFSFHPRKIITTGEGGMLVTNNKEIAEKAYSIKHFGMDKSNKRLFTSIGTNFKISDILSAIGIEQMKKIDFLIGERAKKAKIYNDLFRNNPDIGIPFHEPKAKHTFQSYCINIKKSSRDNLLDHLKEKGIESQVGSFALHLQPAFRNAKKGNLLNSETLHNNLLALPMHHDLTEKEQETVCNEIGRFIK